MRNLKKLLAVIVSICVIATFTVPAFAAESFSYATEAQVLNDLGLYSGISETTFDADLGTALNRETGVVLLLRIFGLEADALAMTDEEITSAFESYTDVSDISSWAKNQMAYAVANGLVVGMTETTIGPKAGLNGKMYCTLILRQLGYTPTYDEAPAQLAEVDGISISEAIKFNSKALIKDDLVGISYASLDAYFADGATVIEKLVELGIVDESKAVAAALIEAVEITALASPADVTLEKGAEVVLPETVTTTYSNGVIEELPVVWAATAVVTTAVTTTPFVVEGTVEGTTLKSSLKVNVIATPPVVVSAVAPSNKTIVVTFDQNVDATSGAVAGNYTLPSGNSITAAVVSGKTVTLTMASGVDQQASLVLTVANVKNLLMTPVATTTKTVTFMDSTVPTAVSAAVTAPNQITVTFSEAIKSNTAIANFVVDNNTYAIYSVAASASSDKALVVTLYATLATGAHTIVVNNGGNADPSIKDFGNLFVPKATLSFTHTIETIAPTVSLVSATQNSVVIKFSETVTGTPVVYHTYDGVAYQGTETAAGDGKTFTVEFPQAYMPVGAANIFVKNDATAVKDVWGNAFVNATLATTIVADTTAPTVTSEYKTATQINVTFSEPVAALAAANFVLTQGSTTIAVTPALVSGTTYKLTPASALAEGAYALTVTGVKDIAPVPNTIANASFTGAVADVTAPTVVTEAGAAVNNFYTQDSAKNVRIYFSEAMNATDLGTKTMYQDTAAGNANPTAATVAIDGKSVYLTFAVAPAGINIGAVKDVAGNKLTTGFAVTLATQPGSKVGAASIKVTGVSTIVVALNDFVTGLALTDFEIDVNGGADSFAAPTAMTIDSSSGKTVVTLTTATAIAVNAWDAAGTKPQVQTVAAPAAKNAYGMAIGIATIEATDVIAPTVLNVAAVGTTVTVTFSESLTAGTVIVANFVGGTSVPLTVTYVPGATTATVTVSDATAGKTLVITTAVKDLAGNSIAAYTKTF